MERLFAAVFVVMLAVTSFGVAAPAGSDAGAAVPSTTTQESPAADFTATEVQVGADGSATWTVRIRTRLASSEDVEEFEAFQERFRENTSAYLGPFSEGINSTVEQADSALGRNMEARDFEASTDIQTVPREWGVVTYEFTWTNFAQTERDRLVVGDVFEGGFFVAENDSLAISGPAAYELVDAEPEPTTIENDTARWVGQRSFSDARPRVVFETPAAQDGGNGTGGTPAEGSDAIPSGAVRIIGVLLALVLVSAGSFVAYRRRAQEGETSGGDGGAVAGGASDGSDGGGSDEEKGGGTVAATRPLTDRERVLDLLADSGGQVKQKAVVDQLNWSKSKTSRVLSSMAEDGDIEKFRIGRENVIRVAEDEESD